MKTAPLPKPMKRVSIATELLQEARIPVGHRSLGVDTYCGSISALMRTQAYLHKHANAFGRGVGLIYSGPKGSMKTFLASYLLKVLLHEDYSGLYITLKELTDVFYNFGKNRTTLDFTLSQLKEVDFLVVDDIEPPANLGEKKSLEELVQIRTTQILPTIFVLEKFPRFKLSHKDRPKFVDVYGDDLYRSMDERNFELPCSIDPSKQEVLRKNRKDGILPGD